MMLKRSNKQIVDLYEQIEFDKASACYACCTDLDLIHDFNLWTTREVLAEYEIIDMMCVTNEMCYRGLL